MRPMASQVTALASRLGCSPSLTSLSWAMFSAETCTDLVSVTHPAQLAAAPSISANCRKVMNHPPSSVKVPRADPKRGLTPLCEAPEGPFRQKGSDPFSDRLLAVSGSLFELADERRGGFDHEFARQMDRLFTKSADRLHNLQKIPAIAGPRVAHPGHVVALVQEIDGLRARVHA